MKRRMLLLSFVGNHHHLWLFPKTTRPWLLKPYLQQQRNMLILSENDVRQCLDMKSCIAINRLALISIVNGTSNIPTRLALPYSSDFVPTTTAAAADWTLFKPASASLIDYHPSIDNDDRTTTTCDSSENDSKLESIKSSSTIQSSSEGKTSTATTTTHMGIKIVSVRNDNPSKYQLPLVPATILHINPITGIVDAVVAGTYLTAARTAAGSALSYQLILQQRHQQQPINNITLFGAGLQAETHLHALYTIFNNEPISLLTIINRSFDRADELKEKAIQYRWIQHIDHCKIIELNNQDAIQHAIEQSDCIITTTNTIQPLWENALPKDGCHIMSIGSYTSDMQEIPSTVVQKCRIYIDTKEAIDVGDIKNSNLILPSSIISSSSTPTLEKGHHPIELLGMSLLVSSHHHQQQHQNQKESKKEYPYTFYKSVGTAIQDILTVDLVVQRARQLGIGVDIDMS